MPRPELLVIEFLDIIVFEDPIPSPTLFPVMLLSVIVRYDGLYWTNPVKVLVDPYVIIPQSLSRMLLPIILHPIGTCEYESSTSIPPIPPPIMVKPETVTLSAVMRSTS